MNEENVVATFFISENIPSSKNSRVWTGTYFIPSAYTRKWIKKSKAEWIEQKMRFIEALHKLTRPYYIEFTFVRKTKHKFDYINIAQAVQDQMVFHGWLEDDDADNIKPYFGDYQYDKLAPGVIIKILKEKPKHYDNQTHNRTGK
jgi:hypothetical protein